MNNIFKSIHKVGNPPTRLRDKLVHDVMDFVYQQLSGWRDDPERTPVDAEKRLNAQLCTYLSAKSHREEKLYTFNQDEFQTGERQIDLAAKPLETLIAASAYDSIYQSITIIEAKRLPAPKKGREKEYLTGDKASGGVQRFKLKLHGSSHDVAGMVGYIQKQNSQFHYDQINKWVDELAAVSGGGWSSNEKLQPITTDSSIGTSRTQSNHPRSDGSTICLHHLWVEMNSASVNL